MHGKRDDSLLKELLDQVDARLMMTDLRAFAEGTKHAGTETELASFHYLHDRLRGLGYRTELFQHDALISLPGPARIEVQGRDLQAIGHSFSCASPPRGLTGELRFLGFGEAKDFITPTRNTVVLVEGVASPRVAARARRAGAAGIVHISPHEHLHEMCISPVWGSLLLYTSFHGPRRMAPSLGSALCRISS